MNKRFTLFFLLLISVSAMAITEPRVTITSPISGQTIVAGQPLEVRLTTNFDIGVSNGQLYDGNNFTRLYSNHFSEAGVRSVSKSISTDNFPLGRVMANIGAGPLSREFGTQGYTIELFIVSPADAPPQGGQQGIPDETPQGSGSGEQPTDSQGPNQQGNDQQEPDENGAGNNPQQPPLIREAAIVTRTILPEAVAGGFVAVELMVQPNSNFPGIIVRDAFPHALNTVLTFYGNVNSFDHDFLQGIDGNSLIKFVVRNSTGVVAERFGYALAVPADAQPGDTYTFDGNWSTVDSNGPIVGSRSVTIAGNFRIPLCPLTDQQLLEYVSQWAQGNVNNNVLLQIIERWARCDEAVPS